jgi:hypothetical protein
MGHIRGVVFLYIAHIGYIHAEGNETAQKYEDQGKLEYKAVYHLDKNGLDPPIKGGN